MSLDYEDSISQEHRIRKIVQTFLVTTSVVKTGNFKDTELRVKHSPHTTERYFPQGFTGERSNHL